MPRAVRPAASAPLRWKGPSRNRAKDSFLAAMSHELRTPLNAIIGFAEIIDAEVFGPVGSPQYGEYVRDIIASARHLLLIIEDVLEISRCETGELVLSKREVDLGLLLAETLAGFERRCRARNIAIVPDLPRDVVVQVDPDKLKRILASLLSNAVKFSADGTKIRVAAELDPTGVVTIAIKDEGIGMDPLEVERAFAPFVQLDDKLSRRFEGSGLGLPLARLLAQLHGGSIRLESRPAVGTTASVVLPAYSRPNGGFQFTQLNRASSKPV